MACVNFKVSVEKIVGHILRTCSIRFGVLVDDGPSSGCQFLLEWCDERKPGLAHGAVRAFVRRC